MYFSIIWGCRHTHLRWDFLRHLSSFGQMLFVTPPVGYVGLRVTEAQVDKGLAPVPLSCSCWLFIMYNCMCNCDCCCCCCHHRHHLLSLSSSSAASYSCCPAIGRLVGLFVHNKGKSIIYFLQFSRAQVTNVLFAIYCVSPKFVGPFRMQAYVPMWTFQQQSRNILSLFCRCYSF